MVGETVCAVRRTSVRCLWRSDILRPWLSMMSWPWRTQGMWNSPPYWVMRWKSVLTPIVRGGWTNTSSRTTKVNDCKCCLGISNPSLPEEHTLCNVELVEWMEKDRVVETVGGGRLMPTNRDLWRLIVRGDWRWLSLICLEGNDMELWTFYSCSDKSSGCSWQVMGFGHWDWEGRWRLSYYIFKSRDHVCKSQR